MVDLVPVTLADLVTPVDQPTYFGQIMAGHQDNGVPWQSWLSRKNVGLSLSQIGARLFATLSNIVTQVARGMFLDYAAGVPLSLLARSQFQIQRTPAQFTVGRFVLSGVAAGRPTTFSAGQLTAGPPGTPTPATRFYTNQDGGTLQPGTLNIGGQNGLSVVAKTPGVIITFVVSGTSAPLTVPPAVGSVITVNSATDVNGYPTSTGTAIAAAMAAQASVAALVTPTAQGTGASIIGALPLTSLDGGALTLTFTATQPGAAGNLPPSSPLVLRTTSPGVSVSNPPYANGTWITSQGADEESDARLLLRCAARWGTLGVGGNADAFTFWALAIPNGYTASPVSQAVVFANMYNGGAAGGAATVCIIGPAGALGAGDVAAVQANFESPITSLAQGLTLNGQLVVVPGLDTLGQKYPVGCKVQVVSATNLTVTLTGTISVYRKSNAALSDVAAAVLAALITYQGGLAIGQRLYPQDKIAGVIGQASPFAAAIAEVDLSGMAPSITPGITQYPLLDPSGLAFQYVDA